MLAALPPAPRLRVQNSGPGAAGRPWPCRLILTWPRFSSTGTPSQSQERPGFGLSGPNVSGLHDGAFLKLPPSALSSKPPTLATRPSFHGAANLDRSLDISKRFLGRRRRFASRG